MRLTWKVRLLGALACLAVQPSLRAGVTAVQALPTGAVFRTADGLLQVDFITDRIARVRATRNPAFSRTPSLMRVPVAEEPGKIVVKNDTDFPFVELSSAKLAVRVDRASGAVSYLGPDGQGLAAEDAAQPRWLERTEVMKSVADPASVKKVHTVDGEREVAERYVQQEDRDAWKGGVKFRFADGEAIYGLGFDETSDLTAVLSEIYRGLRPDGRCFVAEPRSQWRAAIPLKLLWLLARFASGWTKKPLVFGEPHKSTVLNTEEFKTLMASQPWAGVRCWEDGHYQYAVVRKS